MLSWVCLFLWLRLLLRLFEILFCSLYLPLEFLCIWLIYDNIVEFNREIVSRFVLHLCLKGFLFIKKKKKKDIVFWVLERMYPRRILFDEGLYSSVWNILSSWMVLFFGIHWVLSGWNCDCAYRVKGLLLFKHSSQV